eukprot:3027027-Rhodomonas_salina.1
MDMYKCRTDREHVVTNRLGVSRGIKFELEKSWEKPDELQRHLAAGGIKGRSQDINLLCLSDQTYVYCLVHQYVRYALESER